MSPSLTLTSTVEIQMVGLSVLEYLCKRFPYKNQDAWAQSITAGKVLINGQIVIPAHVLQHKDLVSYTSERNEPSVATDIETVFEDEHMWVVNKPAPLPVHSDGFFILNTLIYILRERSNNQDLRLCHRLDRETTGILVLGKNQNVTSKLVTAFEESAIEKWYLTLVKGRVGFQDKVIRGWIGPKPDGKVSKRQHLVTEPREGYKESATHFILQKQLKGYSLLACELLTGRTNQIRAHLEFAGHPVVGDKLYGRSDDDYFHYVQDFKKAKNLNVGNWDHPRHMLHAWKLSMNHPITNQKMNFEAPLPQDMQEFVDRTKG